MEGPDLTQQAAMMAGGLLVPLLLLLTFRALRVVVGMTRAYMGRPDSGADGVVDVSRGASRRRIRGILVFFAMIATAYLFGAWALAGLFLGARQGAPPGVFLVMLGIFLVPVIVLPLLRHLRRRRFGMGPARLPGVPRRTLAAVPLAIPAVLMMYVALSAIYGGVVGMLFGADPAALEAAGLGVDATAHAGEIGLAWGGFGLVMGLAALATGPLLVRASLAVARASAAEHRRADTRPPVLMLRGFRDDRRKILALSSIRRPLIEFLWPSTRDRYEPVLAWEAEEVGPPIAIARPGARLRRLGAARERAPDSSQDWLELVGRWIEESRAVIWSLDTTDGVMSELGELRERGALARTVIVLPPVGGRTLRRRWDEAVHSSEGLLPPCPADPAKTLCVYQRSGRFLAAVAGSRDDASYRAALRRAFGDMGVLPSREVPRLPVKAGRSASGPGGLVDGTLVP